MTTQQLPKGVSAILSLLNLCLSQVDAIQRRHKRTKLTVDERNEWRWLGDAIETPAIACQFRELDREANDYIHTLIGQYSAAVNPDEEEEPQGLTLFDFTSDVA